MPSYFFDTCALLEQEEKVFENNFYISSYTLMELEKIKNSENKNPHLQYKARKMAHLLYQNTDKFTVCYLSESEIKEKINKFFLPESVDIKILLTAAAATEDIIFITADLQCYMLAKHLEILNLYNRVEFIDINAPKDEYTGYKIFSYKNEDELAQLYTNIYSNECNSQLLNNQYIFLKDEVTHEIIDRYKKISSSTIERLPDFFCFESKVFGKTKPKDAYQAAAMDSLLNNRITMLRGAAGTGKSYLSLSFLFDRLEHGKIDKIIIFCNTVATAGSAKLGYYPGSREEKLLDSQIGNFLSSKIGDRAGVEQLVDQGNLILLPMSDIRGYDTTGMHAGVYITEAQNLNIDLMKLALQRIGEDSICILDGDSNTQVDLNLYAGENNGMRRVSEVFRDQDFYGEITLPNIYRSRIAQIAQRM